MFFKRDLLVDDIIRQTDISTYDNTIFDCYKIMIKADKMGMVEQKNKQLFEVYNLIIIRLLVEKLILLELEHMLNKTSSKQ